MMSVYVIAMRYGDLEADEVESVDEGKALIKYLDSESEATGIGIYDNKSNVVYIPTDYVFNISMVIEYIKYIKEVMNLGIAHEFTDTIKYTSNELS